MQTLLTRRNRFGGEAEKMVGAEGAMASHPQRPRVHGWARPSVVCKATVCGTRAQAPHGWRPFSALPCQHQPVPCRWALRSDLVTNE